MSLELITAQIREEIRKLTQALRVLEGLSSKQTKHGGRRNISAAGRANIVAAQKRRWAKIRAGKK